MALINSGYLPMVGRVETEGCRRCFEPRCIVKLNLVNKDVPNPRKKMHIHDSSQSRSSFWHAAPEWVRRNLFLKAKLARPGDFFDEGGRRWRGVCRSVPSDEAVSPDEDAMLSIGAGSDEEDSSGVVANQRVVGVGALPQSSSTFDLVEVLISSTRHCSTLDSSPFQSFCVAHMCQDVPQEIQFDLGLPRRRMLVEFTCSVCNSRTQRLINPEAYKRGTVFVQCAGCEAYHRLVDNLKIIQEFDFREDRS